MPGCRRAWDASSGAGVFKMTSHKDKKRHIREESARTGKSYTTVRAEVEARTGAPSGSTSDSLFLWCHCIQAVGWSPFTKSVQDLFEYFPDVEEYARENAERMLEGEQISNGVKDAVLALIAEASRAARSLDAKTCLLNVERADVLLTQSGWMSETAADDLEWLGPDYEVDVAERLSEGPMTCELRTDGRQRKLVLTPTGTYRVRGSRPGTPAAGKLCRLRLFDHYIPSQVVVEYLDNHRHAVFELHDLEAVEAAPSTAESQAQAAPPPQLLPQQKHCSRCMTPLETRVVGHRLVDVGEDDLDSMTEGQAADYWDESENPSIGNNWSDEVVVELCPNCEELPPEPPRHLKRHLLPGEPAPKPRLKLKA